MQCVHTNYTKEKAFSGAFDLLRELSNFKCRPLSFSGECTLECKNKMKMIYQTIFNDFMTKINNFFDDALIVPGEDNIDLLEYDSYFLPYSWCQEPIFISRVESRFNVGYVNGIPTRLITLQQQQQFQDQKLLQQIQQQPIQEKIYQRLNEYQIRFVLQCRHKNYTVENAINQGFKLIETEKKILDIEFWPLSFSGECTLECKNKMKMIYQIIFNDFMTKINSFFDDALIVPGAQSIGFSDYIDYFNPLPPSKDPLFKQMLESRFNVGYVNDIPTRLITLQQQQQQTQN